MREDMGKVITERPRINRSRVTKRTCKKQFYRMWDFDEFPNKVSIKLPYVVNEFRGHRKIKEFSDLIGPLKRFVLKAAKSGKSFNDIHKEVKKILRGNGISQRHVLGHFFDYFQLRNNDGCFVTYGKSYRPSAYPFTGRDFVVVVEDDNSCSIHYAEPDYVSPPKPITTKEIGYRFAVKHDGIWYWQYDNKPRNFLGAFLRHTMISKKDMIKYKLI